MPHYTVAVISADNDEETIGNMLAPFSENLEVEERTYTDDNGAVETYMCNPNAKWDWWRIGGRWNNYLTEKSGLKTNSTKIKDLIFPIDQEVYDWCIRRWELIVDGDIPNTEGDKELIDCERYKPEYYTERYESKEEYAKSEATPMTFAVLTPDGEWHEPGEMGWFGISNTEPENEKEWRKNYHNFIMSQDPEHYITIVDCHI